MEKNQSILQLFVYGTLKKGFSNHDAFCHGAVSIEPAVIRGRLYALPSGIPVLRVPDEDILAYGTKDPGADVAVHNRPKGKSDVTDRNKESQSLRGGNTADLNSVNPPRSAAGGCQTPKHSPELSCKGGFLRDPSLDSTALTGREERPDPSSALRESEEPFWRFICGEMHSFDDPELRLPPLDALEEFSPGNLCVYRRVLATVYTEDGSACVAWVYVAGDDCPSAELLETTSWEENR